MEKVLWPWYCSHGEVPSHLYVRVCWMVRKDNWIKSYFDAILDIGKSADGGVQDQGEEQRARRSDPPLCPHGHGVYWAFYFVIPL